MKLAIDDIVFTWPLPEVLVVENIAANGVVTFKTLSSYNPRHIGAHTTSEWVNLTDCIVRRNGKVISGC